MRNKLKNFFTKRRIMTLSLVLVVFVMSLGYAALSQYMELDGIARIDTTWDVKIVDVYVSTTGEGQDTGHTYVGNTITTHSSIPTSSSSVTYTITIENQGNIVAKLNHIEKVVDDNTSITYTISGVEEGVTILDPGMTNIVTLTINYADGITNVSDVTKDLMLTFHYISNESTGGGTGDGSSSVMLVESDMIWVAVGQGAYAEWVWGDNNYSSEYLAASSSYYLSGPIQRKTIESISFDTTNEVSTNAIGSWDVSTTGDGQIMAWYTDTNNNGLYEVVIGQNGGVIANTNSRALFALLLNCNSIDLTNLNTSNVTNMEYMFEYYSGSEALNLSNLDTTNVTNMEAMFAGYGSSATLDLSSFDTSKVTNMSYMFDYYKSSSAALDLSSLELTNETNVSYMFRYYSSSATLDLSQLNTSNVTDMSGMFAGYNSNAALDLSKLDTSKVTNMSHMFSNYHSDVILDLSQLNTSNVTDMSYMFSRWNEVITQFDFSKLNTSSVTNMSYMFSGGMSYSSDGYVLDLSGFDTTNVTNMKGMFDYCFYLTSVDLSDFVTTNVIDMSEMFYLCRDLTTLNLSNFVTTNVTDMSNMFYDCESLASLDLSKAVFNASLTTTFSSANETMTITVLGETQKSQILEVLPNANVVIA